jgi:hypothetical protein
MSSVGQLGRGDAKPTIYFLEYQFTYLRSFLRFMYNLSIDADDLREQFPFSVNGVFNERTEHQVYQ